MKKTKRGAGSAARRITLVLETGPRNRRILEALGARYGDRDALDRLIALGRVVMLGSRRGALYGLPGWKGAP